MKIRSKRTGKVLDTDSPKFENTKMCRDIKCSECPVKTEGKKTGQLCTIWAKENLDKAIELLGFEKIEESKKHKR